MSLLDDSQKSTMSTQPKTHICTKDTRPKITPCTNC